MSYHVTAGLCYAIVTGNEKPQRLLDTWKNKSARFIISRGRGFVIPRKAGYTDCRA